MTKFSTALVAAFLSLNAFANSNDEASTSPIVRQCAVSFYNNLEQKTIHTNIRILKLSDGLNAHVSERIDDGERTSYMTSVNTGVEKIRKNLGSIDLSNIDSDELNFGETLLLQAKSQAASKKMKFKSMMGFKLSKVASVRYYYIGQTSRIGTSTIVEARDASGKKIGLFIGGPVTLKCME